MQHEDGKTVAPRAYTIAEFCSAYRVARTKLYAMWKQGQGPRFMKMGNRVTISVEAADDWRRDMEQRSASAKPAAA